MSEKEIQALDNPKEYKKRKTAGDDYINIIYKMLREGIKPEIILAYVLKIGYEGSMSAIIKHIARMAKNNFGIVLEQGGYSKYEYPSNITVIKRNDILKYITTKNTKTKKDKTIETTFELMKNSYPIIDELEKSYNSFYSIIMGNEEDKIDNFIEKYKNSNIKSFIDGIKKILHRSKTQYLIQSVLDLSKAITTNSN